MGKLDLEFEVLKCKIHEEDVLDEVKENLEKRLNDKYKNYEPKRKTKLSFNCYNYFGKAVAVFACCMIVSTCAFADEIEGMFNKLFANTNQSIETAYENGDIKEVDSEYQTYDGVSLKVDYVSLNDKDVNLMISMNTEIDYKKLFIGKVELKDEEGNLIYTSTEEIQPVRLQTDSKRIDINNSTLIFVFSKSEENFDNYDNLKLYIYDIEFVLKDGNSKKVYGNWNF